jgi:hypothetical protein
MTRKVTKPVKAVSSRVMMAGAFLRALVGANGLYFVSIWPCVFYVYGILLFILSNFQRRIYGG